MKNFKLLLATAVLFAVGSAFTASNKTVAGEYVLQGDTWVPIGNGTCVSDEGICDYLKTGSATTPEFPNPNQNPANFTANRDGIYTQ